MFKRKVTFQYNSNATYSTEDLASSNSTVDLVTQKIYLNEPESVQLNFMDILKDHEIIPDIEKNRHSYDGDSWKLSNKVFIALHSRKPKLVEYFHMDRCQLNFAFYCASSALGVSMQHLNHPNMLVRSVYCFHVYYHMRLILYRLKVALPCEERYKKTNNPYLKEDYFQVCKEYGVDPLEVWLFGDWYYTEKWAVFFCNGRKRTKVAPPKNLTRWILKTSKGFTRIGLTMVRKSVRAYVYLSLTSQVQARSKIVGKTTNAFEAQNIYMNSFEELLKSDNSIAEDIARYQGVLQHEMSEVDFSVVGDVYMLPSNMNLNINKTQHFINNILISESSHKLGLDNKVNVIAKQKTVIKTTPKQKTEIKTTPKQKTPKKLRLHEKISLQNHNDEKIALSLLMTGTVLLVYYLM